jgi:hypothetical protein
MQVVPERPLRGAALTADEIERFFPHLSSIICRGAWNTQDRILFNERMGRLGESRSNTFNDILRCRFAEAESAATLTAFALTLRLHRLTRNSTHGASPEEVALEWERIDAEREEILAWGRSTGMLREVVQHYRFERSRGAYSYMAHQAAAALLEKAHPTVVDPVNYAGVLIEWAEREHRPWFWHCCRHQVL